MVYLESLNTFHTAPFTTPVFKYIQKNLSAMNVEPLSTSIAFNSCSEPLWEPHVILTEGNFTRTIQGIFIMKNRPPVSVLPVLRQNVPSPQISVKSTFSRNKDRWLKCLKTKKSLFEFFVGYCVVTTLILF